MKKKITMAIILITIVIGVVIGLTSLFCLVEVCRLHNPFKILSLRPFEKPVKIDLPFQPEHLCILQPIDDRMTIYSDNDIKIKVLKAQANQFLDQKNYYRNETGEITLIFIGNNQTEALNLNRYAFSRNISMWPANEPNNKLSLNFFSCKTLSFKYPEEPATQKYFSFYLMAKE